MEKTANQIDTPQEKENKKQEKLAVKEFFTKLESEKERAEKDRRRNQDLKEDCNEMFRKDAEARRKYDSEWLGRDLFRRGYQFTRYSPDTKTAVLSTSTSIRIPVNLLWMQERIIKNQMTAFRPKWEVVPKGKDQQMVNNARYSGKLLDNLFDTLGLRKMIKETVIQGLNFSVGGPWEVGFDPLGDNGLGEVYIWLRDPYDFYVDGNAPSLELAERVHTAVRKPLDEVRTNPLYNTYEQALNADSRLAISEYKQFLIQALRPSLTPDDERGGIIVKETWLKTRVTEKNKSELKRELEANNQDSDNLRQGEVLMRALTYVDSLLDPLRVRLLRRSDSPFELYQADINPLEVYGESWAKHIIPVNKLYNMVVSSEAEYLYKVAKGRVIMDKRSGVRIINNQHGTFVEKNPGAEVRFDVPPALPSTFREVKLDTRRDIEDLGGVHESSLGRIPQGVKSGVGIAELKSADTSNNSDFGDNLEDFLTRVAKKVLREVAENYTVPKLIKSLGKSGDPEHFMVIGEKAGKNRKNTREVKVGADTFDLAVIGADNQVRVNIGSWLAYTKSAQIDKLKEFYESGLIDKKTFLENAEFGDVQAIVERTREEKILETYQGQPSAAPGANNVSDEEIARQENIQMVEEGKPAEPEMVWPDPNDNHLVHKIIHQEFASDPNVSIHIKEHDRLLALNKPVVNAPAPGLIPQPQMMPQMQPQMPMQGQQAMSPEEAALMQSMQAAGMGGMNG